MSADVILIIVVGRSAAATAYGALTVLALILAGAIVIYGLMLMARKS